MLRDSGVSRLYSLIVCIQYFEKIIIFYFAKHFIRFVNRIMKVSNVSLQTSASWSAGT